MESESTTSRQHPPRYLHGYGLVEAPLEHCVERLLEGAVGGRPVAAPAQGDGVDDPRNSTRAHAVAYLNVLSHPESRRVLFAVNDRCTAVVNNRRDGSDFNNDQRAFSQICGVRTCRVVDAPGRTRRIGPYKVRDGYPARIFALAGPDGRTVRSVACMLDGDRWVFETSGPPLPAEADFPYDARLKRDRFTSEHLQRLVASIGAEPSIAQAFDSAERFVLTAIPRGWEVAYCTPEEADDPAYGYFQRGLGWVPHMKTHAESVVADMTRAVLLNPRREPDARPYLRAARKQLGKKAFERASAEAEQHLRRSGA